MFHARKLFLFCSNQPWIKRDSDTFDVTMGFYDDAEICELVGIFILSLLSKKYNSNNIGLYRDDGLSVSETLVDNKQKNNLKIFRRQRLTNHHKMQSKYS